MAALVVDTSTWADYFNGRASAPVVQALEEALEEGRVYVPPLVAAELSSGTYDPQERAALQQSLAGLCPCTSDLPHWFRVGELRAHLGRKGIRVSTPDAHVVQCALDLDAVLMENDAIVAKIARVHGLQVFDAEDGLGRGPLSSDGSRRTFRR